MSDIIPSSEHQKLMAILSDMAKVASALHVEPFPIYFLGGSACLLGLYTDRATRDFDLVDQHYPAAYGKVLRFLGDFDMLEYESTILSPGYRERATPLEAFPDMKYFVLAREDIVVSKIIRMAPRDLDDMDALMPFCDKELIRQIITEVAARTDLYASKKNAFLANLPAFRERYNV